MNLESAGVDDARRSTLSFIQAWRASRPRAAFEALEALGSLPAVLMALVGRPSTTMATDAVAALVALVFSSDTQKQKPSAQYVRAMGAVVADLLNAAVHDPYWPCKRRMDSNSFTGSAVGYHSTARVLDDLYRNGFVHREIGREGLGGRQGYITRIVPTTAFVEFMQASGIEPNARLAHFAYGKPPLPLYPIRLKASSWKANDWKKIKGEPLYVKRSDPTVTKLVAPIKQLNAYYADHHVELDADMLDENNSESLPYPSPMFFRGFNCGDIEPYHWKRGGRLYAYDGHYQQLRRETRKALLMDGELTAEVDLHACYLTIAYALLGKPLHATDDLYTIEGVDRDAVKMFVNTTLSKGDPLKIWLPDHRKQYDKADLKSLQRQNPISEVARHILAAIPIIKEANAKKIDWSTLICYESEVMIATLNRLAFDHNIFALPMHDGIIVAKRHTDQVRRVFANCFNQVLGLTPIIKIK